MASLPISFLSDYGYEDEFAGVCRGVISGIAPDSALTDLTHGIAAGDVRRGALALANAIPYLPAGVHIAVVDPGVGTSRRALAVRSSWQGRIFVGPDNGLLEPALERCGGALEAFDIGASRFCLEPISRTFHGRDVFAPVAARLALGESLAEAGERVEPSSLAPLALPEPIVADDHVVVHVLYIDRFGNAALDMGAVDMRDLGGEGVTYELQVGGEEPQPVAMAATFGDMAPGQPLLLEDSSGRLALAVNRGSAVEHFGLELDQQLVIRFA